MARALPARRPCPELNGARPRILLIDDLIDDDRAMLGWLKSILEAAGYNVRLASTGADGQAAIVTWCPDAIVIDLLLPDFDGIELVTSIVRTNPTIAILMAMSVNSNTSLSARCSSREAPSSESTICQDHCATKRPSLRNSLSRRI